MVTALGGCSDDGSPADAARSGAGNRTGGASAAELSPDLARAFTGVLDRRAAAVLTGDRTAFTEGLGRGDRAFAAEQATYFDNLAQLPVGRLSYELDRASFVRTGDDYWAVVEVALALEGYDAVPVVTRDRYRFSQVGDDPERYVLSSVTDADWERRNDVWSQPWDGGPITVRTGDGVLGIFDRRSVASAEPLMESVEHGIDAVSALVPYDWSHSVVVYALSDSDFLTTVDDPPGGDPESLDGLTFPVRAEPDGDRVASTRFALHPRMLDEPGPDRDRLVRHELTHVAIGEHDDHAPVWLSEGLAEYVSVRPMAPEDRRVADAAIAAARAGQVTDLPDDDTFNDDDSAVHYGVAWWACEYLATTLGRGTLWALLDDLEAAGAEADDADAEQAEADARLESLTGMNTRTIARKAAKLLLATFDPGAPSTP